MNAEYIEQAVAHYRELLLSQVARAEGLNAAADAPKKEKTVIGLIGGDGIGPIIMAQAQRALDTMSGATYAIGATLSRASDRTWLITPSNVEVERSSMDADGYN